jgi:LysR family pca operon transcriptional activator
VVAEDLADGQLALLPVDTAATTGPVGLTTRTDTTQSLPALAFMQAVRDIAATHRSGPLRVVTVN